MKRKRSALAIRLGVIKAADHNFERSDNECGCFYRCLRCRAEIWDRCGAHSFTNRQFWTTILLHSIGMCGEAGNPCNGLWG